MIVLGRFSRNTAVLRGCRKHAWWLDIAVPSAVMLKTGPEWAMQQGENLLLMSNNSNCWHCWCLPSPRDLWSLKMATLKWSSPVQDLAVKDDVALSHYILKACIHSYLQCLIYLVHFGAILFHYSSCLRLTIWDKLDSPSQVVSARLIYKMCPEKSSSFPICSSTRTHKYQRKVLIYILCIFDLADVSEYSGLMERYSLLSFLFYI